MNSRQEIEIRDRQLRKRIQEHSYESSLYHYTSFSSLYGILKDGELWLGNTGSMNDKKEGRVLFEKLEAALLKNLPLEKQQFCKDKFKEIYLEVEKYHPFAICFSKLQNNVTQWERYADNAKGVCIEFNTYNLMLVLYSPVILFNEVYYSGDITEQKFYKILYRYFTTGELKEFSNTEGLISNAIACGYAHKHESFCSEEEVRAVTLWNYKPFSLEECFKNINGQIRMVLKINLKERCKEEGIDFESLIDRIVIAPRSKQSLYELKEFLRNLGYLKLVNKVIKSDCPLR